VAVHAAAEGGGRPANANANANAPSSTCAPAPCISSCRCGCLLHGALLQHLAPRLGKHLPSTKLAGKQGNYTGHCETTLCGQHRSTGADAWQDTVVQRRHISGGHKIDKAAGMQNVNNCCLTKCQVRNRDKPPPAGKPPSQGLFATWPCAPATGAHESPRTPPVLFMDNNVMLLPHSVTKRGQISTSHPRQAKKAINHN
jgi:hypothetical protein